MPDFERDEEKDQESLFEVEPDWRKDWEGMPEYEHKDLQPKFQLIVSFETAGDLQDFARLVDQKITRKTQSIWYPMLTFEKVRGVSRYADEQDIKVFDESTPKVIEKPPEKPKEDTGQSALDYLLGRNK